MLKLHSLSETYTFPLCGPEGRGQWSILLIYLHGLLLPGFLSYGRMDSSNIFNHKTVFSVGFLIKESSFQLNIKIPRHLPVSGYNSLSSSGHSKPIAYESEILICTAPGGNTFVVLFNCVFNDNNHCCYLPFWKILTF